MLSNQFIIVCYTFVIIAIVRFFIIRPYYLRAKKRNSRYRFFALRDNLYELALTDKIDRSNQYYIKFEERLNVIIKYTEHFNLGNFLEALSTSYQEDLLSSADNANIFLEETRMQSEEVQELMKKYFEYVSLTLVTNSLCVNTVSKLYQYLLLPLMKYSIIRSTQTIRNWFIKTPTRRISLYFKSEYLMNQI